MTMDDRRYRFEDDDRTVTFDEMVEDVTFAVEHDDPDGNTVVGFAIWLNDTYTAWDVLGVSTEFLIRLWAEYLALTDPDELYASTGYREVEE